MKIKTLSLISMTSLALMACGGGGGSDSSQATPAPASTTPTPTPTSTPAPTPTPTPTPTAVPAPIADPNATYETTAELIANRDFNLNQEYQLTVNYKAREARNVYLSLCSDFTQTQESIEVDYNSCLMRTATNSDYSGVVNVAAENQQLVMAIWYLDDINNPRFVVWENDSQQIGDKTFVVN